MQISAKYRCLLLATCAVTFMPSESVTAQTADDASKPEDIIVTAQKREEVLFEVPMSVTAVTGREISERGSRELKDLQYSVPGLSISELAPGTEQVELRGVSVFSGQSTVGVYMDDLPLNAETAQSGLNMRLLDVARVEVLRGPQGTLYGQGAMGGTIRYITNTPGLEEFAGNVSAELATIKEGGTDSSIEGVLNLPIVQGKFGVRVAAAHQHFGGWVDNTTLNLKDANSGSSDIVRGRALWRPDDKLSVSLTLSHQKLEVGSINLSDANRTTTSAVATPTSSKATIANLAINYDMNFATLVSSSGWVDRKDTNQYDLSPAFIPALEAPPPFGLGYPSGTFASISYHVPSSNKIFSQEVRLSSGGKGPLQWTIGGMFRNSRTATHSFAIVTPNIVPFDLISVNGTNPSNSRSWAVFGELAWTRAPQLKVTLGGRYFEDKRKQDVNSATFGAASSDTNSAKFSAFSPRFNLSWTPSDSATLYVNVAKGFRSGGFNRLSAGLGLVTVPPTYDPDTLWSYEFGGRFRSADHRFNAEFSVYYNDWTGVQSLEFANGLPVQYVVNGNDIAGFGVDASASWRATKGLTLSVSGSYSGMEYKNTTGERIAGDPADYVPKFTLAASANYDFHWASSIPGFARLDYQHTDGWQVYPRNLLPAPAFAEKQDYINARIGLNWNDLMFSIFAKNLLDEGAVVRRQNIWH
ncbi:MAG: TonB-dependent receptor [Sphingomonadales bacterium]|nr:TonB-dependent receptor [Sphingomonadales bacterium]